MSHSGGIDLGFNPSAGSGSSPFAGFEGIGLGGNTGFNFGSGNLGFEKEGNFFDIFKDGGKLGKIGDIFTSEKFGKGLGAFSSLAEIYGGFKSLGLASDQFKFQKEAFNKNFGAQVKDYENTLKDRWAARNASASSRGTSFQGMDQWVASRAIDG